MSSKYLANGTIIGGHYKIIDVLGEDDFEILYLVKNIHREGSFFVIKELFLEVFSERKGSSVETIPEAQGVFNKRKAEIIREIDNNLHRRYIKDEIKVFAYFEENNTIYSCMAYTPNAKVEAYLQFEPKEDTKLPRLEELTQIVEEKKKSSSVVLIGVVLLMVVGGLTFAFNQYGDKLKTTALNIWSSDKKPIELNTTQDKNNTVISTTKKNIVEVNRTQADKKIPESSKTELNVTKIIEDNKVEEANITNKKIVDLPKKELNITKQKSLVIEKNITTDSVDRDINITKNIIKVNDSNITDKEDNRSIQKDSNLSEIFSEANLKKFLDNYMKITAHSSSKKIMKLYDSKIKRYFKFKNITPAKVGKSVRAYNRKWKHRNFKLLNFKVLKRYSKNGVNYCDIKTHTKWYVSNSSGKRGVGYSKGFMTIKDTKNGFKVKAVYGIK